MRPPVLLAGIRDEKIEYMGMQAHVFFSGTREELEQLIKDCIKSEIAKIQPVVQPTTSGFISRKKAAQLYGISLVTLNHYCKRGLVPSYRIGNRVLLVESEVLQSVSRVKTFKSGKEGL